MEIKLYVFFLVLEGVEKWEILGEGKKWYLKVLLSLVLDFYFLVIFRFFKLGFCRNFKGYEFFIGIFCFCIFMLMFLFIYIYIY